MADNLCEGVKESERVSFVFGNSSVIFTSSCLLLGELDDFQFNAPEQLQNDLFQTHVIFKIGRSGFVWPTKMNF